MNPKVDIANVALRNLPLLDRVEATRLVLADSVATIAVPLDHTRGSKASFVEPDAESPGASEKFN